MIAIVFIMFGVLCAFGATSAAYRDKGVDGLLRTVAVIALIAIAGFREVGIDQDSVGYLIYYNLTDDRLSLAAEPSFILIAQLTRTAFADAGLRALFVIYAVLGVTLKYLAIDKLTNLFWLSFITYFSGYFLLHEFTQIRAGVACGIVLFSLYYVQKRQPIHFIAAVVIASLFHYSALVSLVLYFLRPSLTSFTKSMIALAIPVAILIKTANINLVAALPIELVRNKIDVYSQLQSLTTIDLNAFNLVYLIKYALVYVFLLFSRPISEKAPGFAIFLQIYALSMASYIALSYNSAFAIRISELYGVVEIVLFPMLVYAFRSSLPGTVAVVALALGNLALGIFQTQLIQPLP